MNIMDAYSTVVRLAFQTAQSMEELYALTMKKKQYIESLGIHYVCNWEHEFHQQYKQNHDMKKFIDDLDIVERLNPRDSFFGGRTNTSKLHYKAKHKEEIKDNMKQPAAILVLPVL